MEQAATRSLVEQAAALPAGSKLARSQVTALLGGATPNAVGDLCRSDQGIGAICAPQAFGILTDCGGFSDVCDSTGTQDVLPINFLCLPNNVGQNVCTAVVQQTRQTVSCTVSTEGKSCSAGCGGSFCAPYANECIEDTNLVQNCFFGGTCSHDTCANQTFQQQVVGTCTRETEGNSCTPLTPCQKPKVGLCNVNAQCACLLGRQ